MQELPRQDLLRLNETLPDFRSFSGKSFYKKKAISDTADLAHIHNRISKKTRHLLERF